MKIHSPQGAKAVIQLGLRANWQQFTLLVVVNAFVGGMVGLERSIVPLLGLALVPAGPLAPPFSGRGPHGQAPHEAARPGPPHEPAPVPAQQTPPPDQQATPPSFKDIFLFTSWKNRTLFSVSQAGLVNNLNDGLAWGLFPLFFAAHGLSIAQIGVLAGIYPGVWGTTQLLTGALSDRVGRKSMIAGGMMLQGVAIGLMLFTHGFAWWAVDLIVLGIGTALVYPTLLAAVSDVVHPSWRASAVGVYRLWRDSGYAIGALLARVLAGLFGVSLAIGADGA